MIIPGIFTVVLCVRVMIIMTGMTAGLALSAKKRLIHANSRLLFLFLGFALGSGGGGGGVAVVR